MLIKRLKVLPEDKSFKTKDADESKYDVRNIEQETINNGNFRKVLYTGKHIQLVLMSLKPNESIGEETHSNVDQFFRFDKGNGFLEAEGKKIELMEGYSVTIKAGTKHNIIAGDKGLKLYTIYGPPNHPPDRLQATKAGVQAEEKK